MYQFRYAFVRKSKGEVIPAKKCGDSLPWQSSSGKLHWFR